jgi:hypothetical protein
MVRNKAAHAVSGHEAQNEYRRHKFNELDHEAPPVVGEGQYHAAVRQKCDKGPLERAWTLCIASNERHSIGMLGRLLFGLLHHFTKAQQFLVTLG